MPSKFRQTISSMSVCKAFWKRGVISLTYRTAPMTGAAFDLLFERVTLYKQCIISFELLAHVLLILISAMISASEWRILKGLKDSNENARNDVVKNDVFFSVTPKNDSWFCTNLTCSMVSTWKSIFDYTFRANFIRPRCFSKIDLIVLLSDQFRSSSM